MIMIKSILRFRDGIGQRSWLSSVVKNVQQALVNAGYSLEVDGRFGKATREAGKAFQKSHALEETGIFDKLTWGVLGDLLPQPSQDLTDLLRNFDGDLGWVHKQEGHRGTPYWPGGISGITLDPGVDLGHVNEDFIKQLYASLLTNRQMDAVLKVAGFKGQDARIVLGESPVLQSIQISDDQSVALMPHSAKPYWNGIVRRFPVLARQNTPASIQTVLLSLAYNRGIRNRHLESLNTPLICRQWKEVAKLIGAMQQSHQLKGIRKRRRKEGMLVTSELAFLAS